MSDLPRPTILAIDDTPDNLTLLNELLRGAYRVLVAKSGSAALELLARTVPPPGLILLDIMMPDMDGFQTLEQLRRLPGCEAVPVLFVSALDDVQSKVRGFNAGAADFITKPFEPEEVLARVRTQFALVNADRMKADVERIMRHDLKSPLHGILATAGFELENDHDPMVRESFQVIHDSGVLLLDMINLSLDLFKIENGTFVLQPEDVDLTALLTMLRRQLDSLLSAGELTWEWTGEQPDGLRRKITGSQLLCSSLLGNLLRNALEACPRGTSVQVRLAREKESGPWTLSIRNPGEIPTALRGRLFQKYATAGKISGTGLGLYSARLIADALNFHLQADTSEAGSTTFQLRFVSAKE